MNIFSLSSGFSDGGSRHQQKGGPDKNAKFCELLAHFAPKPHLTGTVGVLNRHQMAFLSPFLVQNIDILVQF